MPPVLGWITLHVSPAQVGKRGSKQKNTRAGHKVGPWFWVAGPQLVRRLDHADFAGYGEVIGGGGGQFGRPLLRGGRPCS